VKRILVVLVVLGMASGLALPGVPRVLAQALQLTPEGALGLGEIFVGPSPGAVTISAAGVRSSTGGVTLGSSSEAAAARFTVTGEPNGVFDVTLPSSATLSSGAHSMTLDTFTSSPSGSGTLDAFGMQTLTVGATLHVGAAQPSGSYSGFYNVTVAYN